MNFSLPSKKNISFEAEFLTQHQKINREGAQGAGESYHDKGSPCPNENRRQNCNKYAKVGQCQCRVMAESLYGNADSFQHIKGDILFGIEDNIGDLGSATFSLDFGNKLLRLSQRYNKVTNSPW